MNKTAIKNFAIWARNKLIADICYRAGLMGITEKGIADPLPQSTLDAQFYDIGAAEPYLVAGEAIKQRRQLVEVIRDKEKDSDYRTAYQYVMEEVAYTWFNRLIAVRFMEVNDYLPSHLRVLSSESGKVEPDLVTTPFDADLPFTAEEEARIIQWKQDNKLDELFRFLFIKQCNALNEILPGLFEKTTDYTEVLLNLSVVDQEGVAYDSTVSLTVHVTLATPSAPWEKAPDFSPVTAPSLVGISIDPAPGNSMDALPSDPAFLFASSNEKFAPTEISAGFSSSQLLSNVKMTLLPLISHVPAFSAVASGPSMRSPPALLSTTMVSGRS